MMVYGGRKKFSITIHMPGGQPVQRQYLTRVYLNVLPRTPHNFSQEEKMNGLVDGSLAGFELFDINIRVEVRVQRCFWVSAM